MTTALESLRTQVAAGEALRTGEAEVRTALEARLAEELAARRAAEGEGADLAEQLRAALIDRLAAEDATLAARREAEALNQQVAALRAQLGSLQGILDAMQADDAERQVQVETLGSDLNAALAQVAAEQRARADLEAAERARLEAQTEDLERYRSEFFGQLRDVLGQREGVEVVGDRFVFSSEVLFAQGDAELRPEGRRQIAQVAGVILDVAREIPPGIDWILRVDGHTDDVPVTGGGRFADNWELSQARALSVVLYMIRVLGVPPDRLAATGFAEFQPVDPAPTPQARARNRRIELKLTER